MDYLHLALPVLGDHLLHVIAPATLELKRINSKPAGTAPVDSWNFVDAAGILHPPAALEFAVTVDGAPVAITAIGFRRRPLYAPLLVRDLRIENSLYLQLSTTIADGQLVEVQNPGGQLWAAGEKYTATAEPLRYSPAIHVNQEGYVPGLPKKAMIGYFLGSLGELDVPASLGFRLVTEGSGAVVFQGTLTARPDVGYVYWPTPYQKVLEADFSSVTTPGKYQLVVPGLGASLPFAIDEGVAMNFLRTYALGLYQQRCGTDNVMPFTRFVHDACHVAPAEVPSPQSSYAFTWSTISGKNGDYATNPRHTAPQLDGEAAQLYPFVNQGVVDVSGGHHDAGDYSKYTTNSAELAHLLMFTADAIPGAAALDNLGIPESGDGISDILQEAKQETDYLAKLQDADGGFYFIVYPKTREYESNVLPENGDPQVVWPKNTAATAAAVAALAQAASSPRFKAAYPAVAALYLKKAKLGWQFLLKAIAAHGKDGSYQKITFYGDNYMHDDELAWAACEMFVATGEAQYQDQLFEWFPDPGDSLTFRWGWWRMSECWGNAIRSYAFAVRTGRLQPNQLDAAYLAKCEAQIVAAGDDTLRWSNQNAYATSFPEETKHVQSAGWYFSLDQASDMAVAYQISPRAAYLDALVGNLNYEGGTNPVNVTYVTGLGQKRQREIVSQYALNDRRRLPPDGIPLGNIQTTFDYLSLYGTELRELVFPTDGAAAGEGAPYEFYDRWADTFNVTTEYIGVNQARSLLSLSVLATRTTTQTQAWTSGTARIVTPVLTAALGEPTTLSVQVPGFDLSAARIIWEGRDQEPAYGLTYTISPKNNGPQWVEAEIALPDGRRIFALSSFNANSAVVDWVQGAVPLGAASYASGGDAWTWGTAAPATPSGGLAHQSNLAAGEHSHWFQNASATVAVGMGDKLFAWIYLDPLNPPTEVLLSWDDGSAEHRAYWGTNTITWGVNNSTGRHYVGPLPPAGQWVRLSVPASAVGLEGSTVFGMGFSLVDGRATWDTSGVVAVAATPPVITTQPAARTAVVGTGTTFTVVVAGTAPFVYQWSKDEAPLPGATNAVFTVAAVSVADAGGYGLTVTNSAGSTISESALLTVSAASGAPTISLEPLTQAIPVGRPVTLTTAATGNAVLGFQWRKDGTAIGFATNPAFNLASVQTADAGGYDCVVTNAAGTATTAVAALTVTPAFTTQPESQPLAAGASATFTAAATGLAPLTWQWRHNGQPIAGATSPSFTLTGAAPLRDNGWYQVVVTSSSGAARSLAVFVNVAASPAQIVAWGRNAEGEGTVPAGLTDTVAIAAGGAHSVALGADGSVVAWGRNVEGQTTVPAGLSGVVGVAAGLAHTVALKADGTVVAWGANDYGQSAVPAGLNGVVSVAAGNDHTLALRADGTVVAWGDNGSAQAKVPAGLAKVVAIAAGAAHSVALRGDGTVVAWGYNGSGQTRVPVALADVVRIAAGYYHTVALKADGTIVAWGWNGYGQTTLPPGLNSIAAISAGDSQTSGERTDGTILAWGDNSLGETAVPPGLAKVIGLSAGGSHSLALRDARIAPVIGLQPAGVSVLVGQAVTLTATATGVPPPTFQWRKNGAAIDGATSASYTISSAVVADGGSYDVSAANSAGAVSSGLAVLAVGQATPVLNWTAPVAIAYGTALSAVQLNATASVPGSFAYTPAAGAILAVGATQALGVSFTPTDAANYHSTTGATTITVTSNFASWTFARFTTAELADPAKSGPNAIFGLDGVSNLVKYALGLEPKQDAVTGLPEVSVQGTDWVYAYARPTDRDDLTYTIETSANLTSWTTAGVTHERLSTAAGVAMWRGRLPLASAVNVFFRLKAVRLAVDTAYTRPGGGMTLAVPAGQTRSLSLPLLHASVGAGRMIGRVGAVGANFIDVTTAGWTPGGLSNAANPYYLRFRTGGLAGRVLMVATTANTATRVYLSNDGTDLRQTGLAGGPQGDGFELILADNLGTFLGAGALQGGPDPAAADSLQIWNGASWLTFYFNSTSGHWQRDTDTAASPSRNTFAVRPDRGMMLTRNAPTDFKYYLTGRVPDLAPAYWHLRPGVTFLSTGLPVDLTLGALAMQIRASGWQGGTNFATAGSDADLVRVWSGAAWLTFYFDGAHRRWQRVAESAQTSRDSFGIPAGRPIMIHRLAPSVSAADSLIPLPLPYVVSP